MLKTLTRKCVVTNLEPGEHHFLYEIKIIIIFCSVEKGHISLRCKFPKKKNIGKSLEPNESQKYNGEGA